jgi:carboxyl-terminal processing protease
MINKKIQVWLPLLFSLVMIAGMYLGYKMRDNMPGKSFFYTDKHRPMQEIMDLIENKYVDDVKIDSLADTAIQAMLSKLDPHSVFIPAEQLQAVNEDLAGKFFGIGIEFNIFDDTLNVTNVLKGGPGDKAGLVTGDKFLKVGDSIVTGKKADVDEFKKLLRGDRGSDVTVTFLRGQAQKTVTMTRDAIPLASLDAGYMISKDIGYIRLNKFSSTTYHEFMDALLELKKQGLQKLILDLRGNGGGILEEAVDIADEFLDADKLITYTEGKHVPKKEYRCHRDGQFEKGALVVLADEGTASASEILIGALQDWDRATIIGRRTFGKGLVQEQYELSDQSALRLTIARYYTPIGRSIQRPYTKGDKAYYDEISNRYHDGETQFADSIKNDTSKLFKTKAGKKVYGGGGITPDYFIALDTSLYTPILLKLFTKSAIPGFSYRYYLKNQQQLNIYKKPSDFVTGFSFTDADWQDFGNIAILDSVDIKLLSPREKNNLINNIKAAIARELWRTEGYFEELNATDNAIKKAIEVLGN